jgi:hypothetical protein
VTPSELQAFLENLVRNRIDLSTMLWGPPGVGKSSVVAQVARNAGMQLVDVRLSQLAPTDLRGLPVPRHGEPGQPGTSQWYPPEFLPRDGQGILFLDELNMAPPSMQGVAQQLILDRRVGSYKVPDGWFIWAAGNRKEDRASVFEMPAPLSNRFLHLQVEVHFDSFKAFAIANGIQEQLLAFLSFRTELLHKLDPTRPAWPSPRSWMMASRLLDAGLPIESAVGDPAAHEYASYLHVYGSLPDLDAILAGKGHRIAFPGEASLRYAVSVGLVLRSSSAREGLAAIEWMERTAPAEWTHRGTLDMLGHLERLNQRGRFCQEAASRLPKVWDFVTRVAPSLKAA